MKKHAVFAGDCGTRLFNQAIGYLRSWKERGVLTDITPREIWGPEGLKSLSRDDEKIKGVLEGMNLSKRRYFLIRVEVTNESQFEQIVPGICKDYGLDYKAYEL